MQPAQALRLLFAPLLTLRLLLLLLLLLPSIAQQALISFRKLLRDEQAPKPARVPCTWGPSTWQHGALARLAGNAGLT